MNVPSVNTKGTAQRKSAAKRPAQTSSAGAPKGKRPRGRPAEGDKRQQVLDAALTLFAELGYHGTTVPEVAEAAKVGTGTVYRHFETKEALVNEVYRAAKTRLRAALLDGLDLKAPGERWFADLWQRLIRFSRAEPQAFRFLEMQDHAAYLDEASKRLEMTVLAPLAQAGATLHARGKPKGLAIEVAMALVWGAFVGLIKAERLGYLQLTDASLAAAGQACWELVSPS